MNKQPSMMRPATLTVATRAWMQRCDTQCDDAKKNQTSGKRPYTPNVSTWRNSVLIFDTETTTDSIQRLTFGCYRFGVWQSDGSLAVREEGFVYDDDLPDDDPDGYRTLTDFVANHEPETVGFYRNRDLALRSRRDFLDHVLWPAIQADALIVAFNAPFDISRLACDVTPARGKHQGGFSFVLWDYTNPETGLRGENQFRPRIRITQIDAKRSRMDITQPKGRPTGRHGKPVIYRPGFLDLRTLAFALTDRGHSLRSACNAFNVEQGKADAGQHGDMTTTYIEYARQDVKATAALLTALRVEYDRHPIALDPCHAYSPASIAKAYYRAMGITPRLNLQPDFPPEILGYTMSAYYGGRAECAIRRTPVPIVYTDVLSMYPTVNANMDLWRFHIADRIEVETCTDNAQALLDTVTSELVRESATWQERAFYAQIVPDGDVVPVRAQYSASGGTFNIGVNPFHDVQPHWYAGPDLVASVVLTGKVPEVLHAFRLVPIGTQSTLRPVALRGTVPVNPASGDFFRTVIEERKRVPKSDRLNRFLKVLSNSGAYGVYVESNPQVLASGKTVPVTIYGPDETPFQAQAVRPETPGTFSFPPVAALITAGARLVLALIERMVTDAGGFHAFCDTDSMAIVATEAGGLIPCPGGPSRLPDGREAIQALSWNTVDAIVSELAPLNPYARDVVPGSILKIEEVNFDPESGERCVPQRRQVWCLSIAAKRYALFTRDAAGKPTILPGTTRHGLGFLIDPRDKREDEDAARNSETLSPWEHTLWDGIVRKRLGLPSNQPPWHDRPAAMRHTISSPAYLKAFACPDRGKPYTECVKPFNFMLAVPLEHQGRPDGITPGDPFTLITSYESNPKRWKLRNWYNAYSGESYRITTTMPGGGTGIAGVKSLGSVASAYPWHPESKRCGPDGQPCQKHTTGVLNRRPVHAAGLVCIGKEAHRLEERDLVSGLDELQSVYADPRREPWTMHVLPRLRALATEPGGLDLMRRTSNLQSSALHEMLRGNRRPREAVRMALAKLVHGAPASPKRQCAGCGEPIKATSTRQRYCSTRCRKREGKRRERAQVDQSARLLR